MFFTFILSNNLCTFIKTLHKTHLNSWENLCIQIYQQQGKLIAEQQAHEHSPLYDLALPPLAKHDSTQPNMTQAGTRHTHVNR